MRKSSKEDRSNTTGYGSDEDSYTPAFYLDRGHPENFLMILKKQLHGCLYVHEFSEISRLYPMHRRSYPQTKQVS